MSVVKREYGNVSDPRPPETRSILLVIDSSPGEDLDKLHKDLKEEVERLKEEYQKTSSNVIPTRNFSNHLRHILLGASKSA